MKRVEYKKREDGQVSQITKSLPEWQADVILKAAFMNIPFSK